MVEGAWHHNNCASANIRIDPENWIASEERSQMAGGGLMKRVGSVDSRSLCRSCRTATIATMDNAGNGRTATTGALLCTEMQIEQRLDLPEMVAWV